MTDSEKFNADNYSVSELLQLLNLPSRIEDVTENDILTITNSNITKYKNKAASKQLVSPRDAAQYNQLALFYREIQVKLVREAKPVTQEIYDRLGDKNYTSGEPINIGDFVLHGILMEKIKIDSQTTIPEINMKIIKFKSSHIGTLYELNNLTRKSDSKIPQLKYIGDKNKIDPIYY